MKKKTKRTLIIAATLMVLIVVAAAWFVYPLIRYSSHRYAYWSALPENACYQYPIRYSEEGWFLIDCTINGTRQIPLRIDNQATNLMREDSIRAYGGEFWGKMPLKWSNAYQEKSDIDLYRFETISFGKVKIKEPLFKNIPRDETIYDIIGEGVFGSDMLSVGTWKFDTETGIITLFHSDNKTMLETATSGMTYIPDGLRYDAIPIYIDGMNEEMRFTLDLGYAGTLEINNAVADRLKERYPYEEKTRQVNDNLADTLAIFKIPITIAGVRVDSCKIVNSRVVDGNYIGAEFMHRCNFVLSYSIEEHGEPDKDLYLEVR